MEFFRIKRDIPFMRHALVFNVISLVTFLLAVVFLADQGLNLGVDFTGGTVMEVTYATPSTSTASAARSTSSSLGEYSAQIFGTSRRRADPPAAQGGHVQRQAVRAGDDRAARPTTRRPSCSASSSSARRSARSCYENGALALLVVSLGIVGYLAMRFEWRFAVAAIIANLHDVVIILGFFAFFQWEFSLTVLAAVLAILGYSVNESVVVFDRIRENFRKMRKASVHARDRQRHHPHHVAHHHHPRQHPADGAVDAVLRRRDAALLRAGADHRHPVRHLLLGAGVAPLVMWLGVSREDLVKPEKKQGPDGDKILP